MKHRLQQEADNQKMPFECQLPTSRQRCIQLSLQRPVLRQPQACQLPGEAQTFVIQLVPDATQIHSAQAPELDLGQGPRSLSQVTVILQQMRMCQQTCRRLTAC